VSFFKKKFQSILGKYPFSRIDFIIAGTQKGGTTALYEYFRLHQNICMADKKELHFFDEDRYFEKNNPNYSKYHRYFSPNDHTQVIGEATPIYMYWNKSIERIYVYNPQIKLIIILRNPIDRAFSHWNMERDKGRESRTFLKAILDEESKINSPNYSQNKILSYLDRGYYSQQIKNIYNYFNKDQLLILRSEDLRENPDSTLMNVADFLSIPPFNPVDHKEVNSRSYPHKMSKDELTILTGIYEEEFSSLENILGWDLSSWSKQNGE